MDCTYGGPSALISICFQQQFLAWVPWDREDGIHMHSFLSSSGKPKLES